METFKFKEILTFIRGIYQTDNFIPLHEPKFPGNEKKYINKCIDSTFVSTVGEFVNEFENKISEYTGSRYTVVTVNGTEALHLSLLLAGVSVNDEVITQPVTFVATANAISYTGGKPVFVDVDRNTLSISPEKLEEFIKENYELRDKECVNIRTGNFLKACVPVHIFGHPAKIDDIINICNKYNVKVIEDSAESLGSLYKNKHTGTFGYLGILSFNGNKIITTGGGGAILTDNEDIAKQAKHLTTQAKVSHPWEYYHNETGYNYRMPNINAALGLAQLEQIEEFVNLKRQLAKKYSEFFKSTGIDFINEPENSRSNYWLNCIILNNQEERDAFLNYSNKKGVMTRPVWTLMPDLPMFKDCYKSDLSNSKWLQERVVNIPSSAV